MDHIANFLAALDKCGIPSRTGIVADGKLRRYAIPTDKGGKKNGWYRLTIDGDVAFGAFGAWAGAGMSINEKYFSKDKRDYTPADKEKLRARQREAEEQEKIEHAKAAAKARQLWARAKPIAHHPYADRKGIALLPDKVRQLYDKLVVPMYHDHDGKPQIVSLQFISADGTKRFLTGGEKIGCYASFNKAGDSKEILYICEGFATAASIYEAVGVPVVVAFDAGNLKPVAEIIRAKYPSASIIIAGDNDQWTRKKDGKGINNPGVTKAREAAESILARAAWPHFAWNTEGKPTDFNDLHQLEGIAAVRDHLLMEDAGLAVPLAPEEGKSEVVATEPAASFDDWKKKLLPGKVGLAGFPHPYKAKSRTNAELFIKNHEELRGIFIYNEFADQVMIARCPPWEDPATFNPRGIYSEDFHSLTSCLERMEIEVSKDIITDCALAVAKANKVNPPRDYFETLKWDGKHRLDNWLSYYLGAEDQPSEYLSLVGSKWLIGAASRVYEPGCKFDTVLILEGKQGVGKSTVLQSLATFNGEQYFLDSAGDLRNKDAVMAMQGKIIVEMAELASFKKSENEDIKAFITRQVDEYRPPYARVTLQRKRYFVLAASTNEENDGYLTDDTGNRRYWPVKCGKKIDIEALNRDKQQLWAEAVYRYKQGERTWLNNEEANYANREQEKRRTEDAWQEKIQGIISHEPQVSVDFVLKELGVPTHQWSNIMKKRVKASLIALHWYETKKTNKRLWRPSENAERTEPPQYNGEYEDRQYYDNNLFDTVIE
jgi:putative DNA primase/helicase